MNTKNKKQLKILIVDDMTAVRVLVKNLLSDIGQNNVFQSSNAEEALALIENEAQKLQPFDLVVCDVRMPLVSGDQVLKKIRNNKNRDVSSVAFLALTAESEKDIILKMIRDDVDGYIIKPTSSAILFEKILKALEKRGKPLIEKGLT